MASHGAQQTLELLQRTPCNVPPETAMYAAVTHVMQPNGLHRGNEHPDSNARRRPSLWPRPSNASPPCPVRLPKLPGRRALLPHRKTCLHVEFQALTWLGWVEQRVNRQERLTPRQGSERRRNAASDTNQPLTANEVTARGWTDIGYSRPREAQAVTAILQELRPVATLGICCADCDASRPSTLPIGRADGRRVYGPISTLAGLSRHDYGQPKWYQGIAKPADSCIKASLSQ